MSNNAGKDKSFFMQGCKWDIEKSESFINIMINLLEVKNSILRKASQIVSLEFLLAVPRSVNWARNTSKW